MAPTVSNGETLQTDEIETLCSLLNGNQPKTGLTLMDRTRNATHKIIPHHQALSLHTIKAIKPLTRQHQDPLQGEGKAHTSRRL